MGKCWHEAPFLPSGQMSSYGGEWNAKFRAVEPFTSRLTFDHFARGRSSAIGIFKDEAGKEWPMFLTDLADAIPLLGNGAVEGVFVFTKRGTNYAIKLAA